MLVSQPNTTRLGEEEVIANVEGDRGQGGRSRGSSFPTARAARSLGLSFSCGDADAGARGRVRARALTAHDVMQGGACLRGESARARWERGMKEA